jgi:hypothetical protein
MTVSSYALVAGAPGGYVGFRSGVTGSLTPSTFSGAAILRAEHDLTGVPVFNLLVTGTLAQDDFETLTITNSALGEVTYNSASAIFLVSGGNSSWSWPQAAAAPLFVAATSYAMEIDTGIRYNCECDDDTDYETLSQLRTRLMVRLGYAGQVANPPPGMASLLDDFLQSSQRLLYMKYTELHTERFFTWTMEEGIRFYDLPDNDETCTKRLNALKITWAGVEDLNGAWRPIVDGIPPEYYTGQPTNNSIPQMYEIRQCIEVYPAPDAAYKLRIKGHYKLGPFTADDDQTTIDSELVFLWSLAVAKAHYGHADANNIAAMANDYLGRLVSGNHGTRRYVPRSTPAASAVRPVMRDGYDA